MGRRRSTIALKIMMVVSTVLGVGFCIAANKLGTAFFSLYFIGVLFFVLTIGMQGQCLL